MKLFLSGGGSGEKSALLDQRFAETLDKSKTLLYIPIAIDKTKHPYNECLKWINKSFNHLGINKIELWTESDLINKEEKELEKFGGVYIGGGNTYYLLKEIRDSKFIDKLKKIISLNIPVYGGSAGAIILGKTILTSPDENNVKLKEFGGLNVIKGYSIFCHVDKEKDLEWVRSTINNLKIDKSIALSENSGLYVNNKEIEIIGPGVAYLPKDSLIINPGSKIK